MAFLQELAPFIWRKYLDFAAIADIHAMKRQIHAFKGFGHIAVAGHDIKVGRGGIREIEFFVQTQQLIAGGRQTDLRTPQTLAALSKLAERGWIKLAVEHDLADAYRFLRRIEHRLQMIADEQTQTLPESAERPGARRPFLPASRIHRRLLAALMAELARVQSHYAALFENTPDLSRDGANMVFAGEADDPSNRRRPRGHGLHQPFPGHRFRPRLASWPLSGCAQSARARAPDGGAAPAHRRAVEDSRSPISPSSASIASLPSFRPACSSSRCSGPIRVCCD